jgi:hypothetical protein
MSPQTVGYSRLLPNEFCHLDTFIVSEAINIDLHLSGRWARVFYIGYFRIFWWYVYDWSGVLIIKIFNLQWEEFEDNKGVIRISNQRRIGNIMAKSLKIIKG